VRSKALGQAHLSLSTIKGFTVFGTLKIRAGGRSRLVL
jgi:hypothetical protein